MERIAERIMLSWGMRRALLAFAAGAFAALGLPPVSFFPVLFVSFPVLVWLIDGAAGSADASLIGRLAPAFWTGWWFGFGWFTAGLWWIGTGIPSYDPALAWAVPLALIGLPAALAIFMALGVAAARLLWSDGIGRIAALSASLGLADYLRGFLFTGFPWNPLGLPAMPVPLMMQSVEVIGYAGMSILSVFVFSAPALIGTRRGAVGGMVAALALMCVHIGYGALRLGPGMLSQTQEPPLPVVRIVQPAIQQNEKFAPGEQERIFGKLLEMSMIPPTDGLRRPDYIIWPETALPFILAENPAALSRIEAMLQVGQTLVTGAVRAEEGAAGTPVRYYNTIHVIDDAGQISGGADKAHLVPFGEYLPFDSFFRGIGLRPVAEAFGGYVAADRRALLALPGGLSAVPLICYEAIFPDLAGIEGQRGSFLLNLTNDGWFSGTPGPSQHLQHARLRAVEMRTPMVRAANSGISAVIDPQGRIVSGLPDGVEGVIDVEMPAQAVSFWANEFREFNFWLLCAMMVVVAFVARTGKMRSHH